MAYDFKQRLTAEDWRTYLLHVECVRRNPQYRDGYEEWKKEAADDFYGDWYKLMVSGRWGLLRSAPLPGPDERLPFDAIRSAKPPKGLILPQDEQVDPSASRAHDQCMLSSAFQPAESVLPDSVKAGMLFLTLFPEQSPDKHVRTVLNIRRSKRALMQSCERFIDLALAARKEAGLSQQVPRRRVRLEECLDCLKVFDLKQSGKTHAEIGESMWPNSRGDIEKKSQVYYQKAKDLIDSPPLMRGRHDEAT